MEKYKASGVKHMKNELAVIIIDHILDLLYFISMYVLQNVVLNKIDVDVVLYGSEQNSQRYLQCSVCIYIKIW